jgi:hypothetical protein
MGAAAPAQATSAAPPYNPHLKLNVEWGNGSRVVGDQLTLTDDAQPLTAKQFKGQRHYKLKSNWGRFESTLPNGTPVVNSDGKAYTLDSKGKAHPYFSGSVKPAEHATSFKVQGNTVISPLNDQAGNVRIYRGANKPVITVKAASSMSGMAVYNHRLYWDRQDDNTGRWQVMATSLSTGKTTLAANDAMSPSAVDDGGVAVVKMQHTGKRDSLSSRPIRGVQLLDGAGTWLLRRHGTWPVNYDGAQVVPVVNGSVIAVPATGKNSATGGETVIDLNNHKAWDVVTSGATIDDRADNGLAAWQLAGDEGSDDPTISLVLNTEKNALYELRSTGKKAPATWNLNGRALGYHSVVSQSEYSVVTGVLR